MPVPPIRLLFLTVLLLTGPADRRLMAEDAASRRVRIDYQFQISDVPAGQPLRVWCPVPQDTPEQTVTVAADGGWQLTREPRFGNRIAYRELTATAAPSLHALAFVVERKEVVQADIDPTTASAGVAPSVWLQSNRLVPVAGRHVELMADIPAEISRRELGQQVYSLVLNHVDYRKDQPGWGRGDTAWVCDSRFGNCTDFHSLFISMMRSRQVPARFEIGFSIPSDGTSGELSGYHCWAWFQDEDGVWVPVDISEADKHPDLARYYFGNLNAHRVAMSVGRDLELVPRQAAEPLNFFVAPYAEAAGKPVPKEQIKLLHRWSVVR